MSEKSKMIHKKYCNYEVDKAKAPSKIYSVKAAPKRQNGIRTSGLSKAILAQMLLATY